ncbi:telomere length regulation protein-domain-containing protein [Flammula alnicola]|nr:telomere length regulation protein-domain-containing protein [Flammula alnicola]
MDSIMDSDSRAQIQELLDQLHTQIADLPTLLSLLSGPLDAIGLLPPQFRRYNTRPLPSNALTLRKHVPQIQRVLLTHIAPAWSAVLAEPEQHNAHMLLEQYFCPDVFANVLPQAGEVAMLAYATLVSSTVPLTAYAIRLLGRLAVEYPVDRLYEAAFARRDLDKVARGVAWEDCVRNICMVPAKVANAVAGKGEDVPPVLENAPYFNNLSVRCEELIFSLSTKSTADALPSLAYLLGKLVNIGLFPPSPPVARSQPSFFQATLPSIRSRLHSSSAATTTNGYSAFWSSLFLAIPSSLALQSILTSLFATLSTIEPPTDDSPSKRARVRQEAALLDALVGKITPEKQELWEIGTSLMMSRDWHESYARVFVCWLSGGSRSGQVDLKGIVVLDAFLEMVLDTWSSPEHVKHSLISRHRYITSLLLVTVSYFPPSSPYVQGLVSTPNFINGISIYISHLDQSVRRCGMLAAEVIARLCDKKLNFDGWEGDELNKVWCRALRQLVKARDVDAPFDQEEAEEEVAIEEIAAPGAVEAMAHKEDVPRATFVTPTDGYDSDDSMTGYASPPSSRSASPTPSELAEIEKDPTLNVGLKKVSRPVYLAQLGDLLRGGGAKVGPDDPHEADRIEMALNSAEELIRKKKGYGTELDENAVNLAYALLSLQDNFDLEGFSDKRQCALNALVAGAPRKAAPALIQEFFKNQYAVDQRFVALNALALGARELASLPIPPSKVSADRTAFPSKMLPAPLHRKYIAAGRADTDLVPRIMDDISKHALDKQQQSADSVPELVRERRLRIQKPRGVTEVTTSLNPFSDLQKPIQPPSTRFLDVAAEFFVVPLINQFWAFLRDEQAREDRTSQNEGRARYRGAGTGLILNPLVLAQFLRTLAILVNASQNAPEWLAIIAPDSLELAVTLGTRPVSHMETADDDEGDAAEDGQKEASVLTSALELALVVLDGALEIDGGRILGLEHTALVLGLGEWAGKVFASLEKGLKVQGGGGMHEAKLSRAAAGVLLKVDELTSKWRRSMLDTR